MIESVVGILLGIGLSLNAWAGLRLNKAIGELNNRVTALEVKQIQENLYERVRKLETSDGT